MTNVTIFMSRTSSDPGHTNHDRTTLLTLAALGTHEEGPERPFQRSVGPALHVFEPRWGERHQGLTVLALGLGSEVSKENSSSELFSTPMGS